MNLHQFSDRDLLNCILGVEEATSLYRGKLTPLFASFEGSNDSLQKLAVARELVKRYLAERLQRDNVMTSPGLVQEYLRTLLAGREHECFVALFLDSQHRLIESEELFRGTVDGAAVYPREVLKRTLAHNAAAVIFAHNHPSGIPEPSAADRVLTDKLKQALAVADVQTLDHFVIGEGPAVSFAERGWL